MFSPPILGTNLPQLFLTKFCAARYNLIDQQGYKFNGVMSSPWLNNVPNVLLVLSLCYIIICRMAKAKMDDQPFFSKQLHICYAPEYETVDETRQKLQERRKVIAKKTRGRLTHWMSLKHRMCLLCRCLYGYICMHDACISTCICVCMHITVHG